MNQPSKEIEKEKRAQTLFATLKKKHGVNVIDEIIRMRDSAEHAIHKIKPREKTENDKLFDIFWLLLQCAFMLGLFKFFIIFFSNLEKHFVGSLIILLILSALIYLLGQNIFTNFEKINSPTDAPLMNDPKIASEVMMLEIDLEIIKTTYSIAVKEDAKNTLKNARLQPGRVVS